MRSSDRKKLFLVAALAAALLITLFICYLPPPKNSCLERDSLKNRIEKFIRNQEIIIEKTRKEIRELPFHDQLRQRKLETKMDSISRLKEALKTEKALLDSSLHHPCGGSGEEKILQKIKEKLSKLLPPEEL